MEKTAVSLFAGVGGIDLGFERAGFKTIFANEMDEYARQTYSLNFPGVHLDPRDVRTVEKADLPTKSGVLLSGFPCQSFSIAGYRLGLEDEKNGDLFFQTLRIAKMVNADVLFLENVKNLVSHDHGKTFKIVLNALDANGYSVKYKVLNSRYYGDIPQNRERIFMVAFKNSEHYHNFEFPDRIPETVTIRDLVDFENPVEDEFYVTPERCKNYDVLDAGMTSTNSIYQWRRYYLRENASNVCPTLTANMGVGGWNVPLIRTDDGRIRELTPRESFRLQEFPDSFRFPQISKKHLYKQSGNSVTVPVIERIAKNIADSANGPLSKPQGALF